MDGCALYYVREDGARELLAHDPAISCLQPVLLTPRRRPQIKPSTVDYKKKTGTYYVQDVYIGPGLEGIERGTVKKLRVVALEFRAAGVGSNGNGGPAGGALVLAALFDPLAEQFEQWPGRASSLGLAAHRH